LFLCSLWFGYRTQFSFEECGWGAKLQNVYQRRADVVCRGYSGYNTRWAIKILPNFNELPGVVTRIVTVFFGANDASLVETNPRQHVPLDEFSSNLKTIVEGIRVKFPSAEVILITPPPIDEEVLAIGRMGGSRTNDSAGRYAAAVVAVGIEVSAPVCDLWTRMQSEAPIVEHAISVDESAENVSFDWRGFLSDGLHLSTAGQRFVSAEILSCLSKFRPDLSVVADPFNGSFGNSGSKCGLLAPDAPWHDQITDPTVVDGALAAQPPHLNR
jgi:isoamyl acetate esterase